MGSLIFMAALAVAPLRAQPGSSSDLDLPAGRTDVDPKDNAGDAPILMSLTENINDFGRFADGGSDSNWYVGFNNAWIVKLPPAPAGNQFARAFIGAKLGRAKCTPKADRPWELSVIPGKVYMAIAQKPSFPSERSFFLADTDDIPLEADANTYVPGVGSSRWFWAEVRPGMVSTSQPNYLIVWSPGRELHDAAHSPILAAAEAADAPDAEPRAWNNHSIQGVPPRGEANALQVPIKIRPALALKLVPRSHRSVVVSDPAAVALDKDILVTFSVEGKDIEEAWVEFATDELEWDRVTPLRAGPPYSFTIARASLPGRNGFLRAKARDWTAAEGTSRNIQVPHNGAR